MAPRRLRPRPHPHRLGLALLFASCGFVGEDDFPGARIGGGGAPFSDLGLATVCLTPTLLGPADSDPAGICLPQGASPGGGCTADRDCRGRERCVCGTCSVQYCDGPGQCGAGRECNFRASVCGISCSSAAPCPARQICDRGFCTAGCTQDGDCGHGEICSPSSHRCSATGCKTAADCLYVTEDCAIQRNPAELREPSLVASPRLLFLELRPAASGGVIYRATTSDGGQTWRMDPPAPVLEPDPGETRVGAPSVLSLADGRLVLYFEQAQGLGRAVSADQGRSFVRDGAPVLRADAPWEAGRVASPAAAELSDGEVLLFFEGGDGAGIGLAQSPDGIAFTKNPGPVVTASAMLDPVLWRELDRIGQPFARAARDATGREIVSLWFSAHGVETAAAVQSGMFVPPVANDSIGFCASLDGGHSFVPYPFNPVFDRVEQFLEHDNERAPAVSPQGDGFLLIYELLDPMARLVGLGIAENPGEE